tara:strand:+ start:255 stop:524 length:270 start_codon:yes stop_codon:yes gene_type:complete
MKRIIRENTLSTKQHYEFEGTDEQKTDEAWEVTCGYLGAKQKAKLEWSRDEDDIPAENAAFIACIILGVSGDYPYRAMLEFFEGKREFS